VIDAGANTLDDVLADGTVRILAYIPNPASSDSVPTCIAMGPDHALYIGTLSLQEFFDNGPGSATVYRVDPNTVDPANLNTVLSAATVWATGLTTISACAFRPGGDFYATEMFANDVVRVPFAHPATGRINFGSGVLSQPGGVAVRGTNVYVSNNSNSATAGSGEIVRFGNA
jgi:hypothetical protein